MYIKNKEYYWISCCMGDDFWTECKNTGIKIWDLDFKANDNGELIYQNKITVFPKGIEL